MAILEIASGILFAPLFSVIFLSLVLASFGKSLGIRRLYVKFLLRLFEVIDFIQLWYWISLLYFYRTLELHHKWNVEKKSHIVIGKIQYIQTRFFFISRSFTVAIRQSIKNQKLYHTCSMMINWMFRYLIRKHFDTFYQSSLLYSISIYLSNTWDQL